MKSGNKKARKSLGMGLTTLLGVESVTSMLESKKDDAIKISLDKIRPNPWQPRIIIEDKNIDALAQSIKLNGVLQPIIVRLVEENQEQYYEIVAGERRWRAAQLVSLESIPVVIRELTDVQSAEIALIENLQRENLTALEEAQAYKKLLSIFNVNQATLADNIGKSQGYISNTLRLLNLPKAVKKLLLEQKITAGHARALLGTEQAEKLALHVVDKALSVRQTEELVKKLNQNSKIKIEDTNKQIKNDKIENITTQYNSDKLKYKFKKSKQFKITFNFEYSNEQELEFIEHHIKELNNLFSN